MSNLYFRTFFALLLVCISNALYEDQVGKFDWKQSYVGRVKYSHIDYYGKRVFVATENNVIACLNIADGSLLWRKVLEWGDAGTVHILSVGSEVTTVSGNGPFLLRGWSLKSGLLTYEWSIPGLPNSDYQWTHDSNKIYQVRIVDSTFEISEYDIRTGTPSSAVPKRFKPDWFNPSFRCLLDNEFAFCVTNTVWYALSLSDLSVSHGSIPSGFGSEFVLNHIASSYPAVTLESVGDRKEIVVIVHTGDSVVTQKVDKCISQAVKKTFNAPVLLCASHNEVGYELHAFAFGEPILKASLGQEVIYDMKLPKGFISSITDVPSDVNDNTVLIVGNDDSLILVEKYKVHWVREEALANVLTAEMVDLPVSDEEAAIETEFANKEGGIIGMFWRRIHSQVLQVINFPMSILGLKQSSDDAVLSLRKDQFGLNKLIVIVTKASKIYGVESNKGRIIWQIYLENVSPFNVLGKLNVPVFLQRNSRHFTLPSLITLLFKQKDSDLSALCAFNPITGQPLYGGLIKLNYKVKQTLLLPKEDDEFIKGLVLLTDKDEIHVFPESSKQIALDLHKSLYMFTVDPKEGLLEGYSFVELSPKELGVTKIWNVRLNPPIVSVAIKNRAERVHSQGRVLADRSVLYKYINPHLIAVATHNTDPVHKNIVTVSLIDSVNGAIIYYAVHKRATPPVFVIHSENWVVYSIFNDKSRRTEFISLDLYEGRMQRNSTEFSSVTATPLDPFIEKQAYIFPHNVMAMRETITEKGITNKHVLVGVSTGSVMEVPWALLDPHRSPDGREEGVIPYSPDLSLPPEAILTYNHTLPHIAGIHTSPSGLESTSLVLIYGLDLFYTRVAPSKTFDVLKDDFEYWLITLVLGGLIAAAYITKKLASQKALRLAWK